MWLFQYLPVDARTNTVYLIYMIYENIIYVYKSLNIRTFPECIYIFFCIRCHVELRPEHGTWKWMGFRCRKSTDNSGESKLAWCLHIYTYNFICCIYIYTYICFYMYICRNISAHSMYPQHWPQSVHKKISPKFELKEVFHGIEGLPSQVFSACSGKARFLVQIIFWSPKKYVYDICLDESMVWWNGWTIFSWPKGSE